MGNMSTGFDENRTKAHSSQTELRLGELHALLSLVDEPNDENYILIRDKILSYGEAAVPELEALIDRQYNETVLQRVMDLIQNIQYDAVYAALKLWNEQGADDLLQGYLIVSRYQYPNLDDVEIRVRLDQLIRDVWLEINNELTALEKVKVINHVLFDVHGFAASRTESHTPQDFYLNTLLDSKKGSPVSLGILYMLVAHRLDIPVFGVNLPRHFILAYIQENPLSRRRFPGADEVLFYLNPFNRGTVFTRNEIDLFIRHIKLKPDPAHYSPCTHRDIIRRLLNNLVFSYEQAKKPGKAGDIGRFLSLLD